MQSILRTGIRRVQPLAARRSATLNASRFANTRSSTAQRFYSTEPAKDAPGSKNPGQPFGNLPLYLSTAGLVGIGYYVFALSGEAPKKAAAPAAVTALDKDNFVEFPLVKKEDYNHNTAKFTFKLPDNAGTLLPVAGLVLVKAASEDGPKDKKGNPIVRPYTPISPSDLAGEFTLMVKKYDTGKFTPYLFDLKVGDKLAFKGPLPKIPYKPNEFDQVAMIAGGSGITPMYQVINHALKQKDDKTKFTLIFSNVSPADILLREEFEKLKKAHPDRFEPIFVVDKPSDSWTGYTGYISGDLIKEHVKGPNEKVKIYVCGPPGQVKAICGPKDRMNQGPLDGILKELGYSEDHVFKF
ncbi:putative cytochrome-b5 reductase [Clavulina sp. PMI_390]|nr:putative cytochrome-b5 reductase [Clavulina sp. PMI_390]